MTAWNGWAHQFDKADRRSEKMEDVESGYSRDDSRSTRLPNLVAEVSSAYDRTLTRLRRMAIASLVFMLLGVAAIHTLIPRLEPPVRGYASSAAGLLLGVGFIGLLLAGVVAVPLARARTLHVRALRAERRDAE